MLFDEDRMQRRGTLTIPTARRLDGGQRIQHRAGPQPHAGLAQGAGEVDDVLRQDAAACRLGFQIALISLASTSLPAPARVASKR